MSEKQRTIQNEIQLTGVGLHTGNTVSVSLKPAGENEGIYFVRVDLPNKPVIQASVENICREAGLPRCTSIGCDGAVINTVEHLLGVLSGLGVDNLRVEIDNNEMPGLDGSGIEYFQAIKKSGLVAQEADREYIEIKSPVGVHTEKSSIFVVPHAEYKISYTLDYNHPHLDAQFFSSTINSEIFERDIAPCRTFCLEEEAEQLLAKGLGKGANYDNTLVVGAQGVIGNQVRFTDEFVRHKVLDFIGDLYLLGKRIRGHVFAVKSGHELNWKLLEQIVNQAPRKKEKVLREALPSFAGETQMDIHQIMQIIPHRYPFLLVDRIIELDPGKRAVGIKNVTINEDFFNGHFPQKPIMPGVLMVEAMAQVGGIVVLTSEAHRGKLGLFMATDKVKFRKMVEPGDQLVIELEIMRDRSRTALLHGRTKVNEEIVAEADVTISFVDEAFLKQ